MSKHFYNLYAAWGLVLLGCACCGCGAGAYEKRLNARLQELKQEATAGFNMIELADSNLSLGVPKEMKDAGQAKPPVAIFDGPNLPAWKVSFEAFSVPDANGGQQPYYCYIGVAAPGTGNVDSVAAAIKPKLEEKYPGKSCYVSDVPCRTLDGQNITCKEASLDDAPDAFIYKGKNMPMPGTVDAYLRDVGGSVVVIVWRMPITMKETVGLKTIGPKVAGSISAK